MLLLDFEVTGLENQRFLILGKTNHCLLKLTNWENQSLTWRTGQRLRFYFRQGVVEDFKGASISCKLKEREVEVILQKSLVEAYVELRAEKDVELKKDECLIISINGLKLNPLGGSRTTAVMAELSEAQKQPLYKQIASIDLLQAASVQEFHMPVFEIEHINASDEYPNLGSSEYLFAGRLHPALGSYLNLRDLKFDLSQAEFKLEAGDRFSSAKIWFAGDNINEALTGSKAPVDFIQPLPLKNQESLDYPKRGAAFIIKVTMEEKHKLGSVQAADEVCLEYKKIKNLPMGSLRLPFPKPEPTDLVRKNTKGEVLDGLHPLLPKGTIVMWSGSEVPEGWALCDGKNRKGTKIPNLCDKFIIAAGRDYSPTDRGGSKEIKLKKENLPTHSHQVKLSEADIAKTDQSWSRRYTIDEPFLYRRYKQSNDHHTGTHKGYYLYTEDGDSKNPVSKAVNTFIRAKHKHTVTESSVGNGTPYPFMPSYYALAFIIKI